MSVVCSPPRMPSTGGTPNPPPRSPRPSCPRSRPPPRPRRRRRRAETRDARRSRRRAEARRAPSTTRPAGTAEHARAEMRARRGEATGATRAAPTEESAMTGMLSNSRPRAVECREGREGDARHLEAHRSEITPSSKISMIWRHMIRREADTRNSLQNVTNDILPTMAFRARLRAKNVSRTPRLTGSHSRDTTTRGACRAFVRRVTACDADGAFAAKHTRTLSSDVIP